jgi:hypothetical protein
MPSLGFTRLLDKLRDGSKTQTIRAPRKQPLKVGDTLHIFWKMRTKQCQKLGEGTITKIQHKCVANMTNQDAKLDGFEDDVESTAIQKLALALRQMHPETNEFTEFDIITWAWTKKSPFFYG